MPGDTFNITTSAVVRLQTPLTPIMDNMYMDTYYFYVPMRIIWSHAKNFFGENADSPWIPQTEYIIPTIKPPTNGFAEGTIADYLGIPIGVEAGNLVKGINALPFRAYAECCQQWFRDQNLTDPLVIPYGDETVNGSNGSNYITDVAKGGKPFVVAKYHDYFTSCLPSPQKSQGVGVFSNELGTQDPYISWVPVTTRSENADISGVERAPFKFRSVQGQTDDSSVLRGGSSISTNVYDAVFDFRQSGIDPNTEFQPLNLWANVGQMELSINQLRLAFQLQKFYEKNARAGTRYREILKEHFGVSSSDARMQIPEYLGGHRFPLTIHQVANQSQGSGENDFLGDLGAMSNTADINEDFIKSFEEHGFVIGVCCVRYDHSYPQGLERMWRRSTKTDYYWPVFANIGEQPVYKSEIMLDNSQTGTEVFGYQEAWAEYRYKPSRVSSSMRPNSSQSLASWHLADNYQTVPSLSDSWIREDKTNVDRVLSVASSVVNQVFCDFYIKNIATRPMPMYSVPGLIDHH